MAFRYENGVKVSKGDIVEKDGIKYRIQCIMPYLMVTALIVENLKTHAVETLPLRDVKKV